MAKKELGYVELEWTCKRCGTKNPGTQKLCGSCGGPMEANEQFSLPEQQKLIEDEKQLAAAKKGADRQCPYCGARNPADAPVCGQCAGDLKTGVSREVGQVMGAFQTKEAAQQPCRYCSKPIAVNAARCPHCGGDLRAPKAAPAAAAPAKAAMPLWLIILLSLLGLVCLGGITLFACQGMQTESSRGTVQSVEWNRTIEILAEQPVDKGAWEEDVPNGATNLFCQDKYRETSSQPAPNSTEVCGEPYTVDQGNGTGKVVQDCEYQIYASYCEFKLLEWVVVNYAEAQGADRYPDWPTLNLAADQREGDRRETYSVTFAADGQTYSYTPRNESEFSQYSPGSEWTLHINGFGSLTSVEP